MIPAVYNQMDKLIIKTADYIKSIVSKPLVQHQ